MSSEEQLKAQRHTLYCTVADLCQRDANNATTESLLRQLQAVLEAESCFSCVEEPQATAGHQSDRTSTGNTCAAVQMLHDELTQRTSVAGKQPQRSSSKETGAGGRPLTSDLLAERQAQAEFEGQLLAAKAAALKQKQKHQHDVKAWKLAAEQAAGVAEAASQKLAAAQQALADQSQQLAQQAEAALMLRLELQQAQQLQESRNQHDQLVHDIVLGPLLMWHHKGKGTAANSGQLNTFAGPASPAAALQDAAAALNRLIQNHHQGDVRVAAAMEEGEAQWLLQKQQLQQQVDVQNTQLTDARRFIDKLQQQLNQLTAAVQTAEEEASMAKHLSCHLIEQLEAALAAAGLKQEQLQRQVQHLKQMLVEKDSSAAAAEAKQQSELAGQSCQIQELQRQVELQQQQLTAATSQAAAFNIHIEQVEHQLHTLLEQRQQAMRESSDRLVQLEATAREAHCQLEQRLSAEKDAAVLAAQQHASQELQAAQQAWQKQRSELEQQQVDAVLQARVNARKGLEDERQQLQQERDALLQKLTAQHTAAELQWQAHSQLQRQHLLAMVSQLKQDKQQLMSDLATAASAAHILPSAAGPLLQQPSSSSNTQPAGGYAVQFNQALVAAESGRKTALRTAKTAQDEAQQLQQQLQQQDQELMHIKRAVEELRCALAAAEEAAKEAEASAAASTAAAQKQTLQVEQLQLELLCLKRQHEAELVNMQQALRQQVVTIQADARAELEAAQKGLQLLRLKQQRLASCVMAAEIPGLSNANRNGVSSVIHLDNR